MRTLRLTIEYDGTGFVGWQSQVNGRSVQDEIERVLGQVLGSEVRIAGAGRTDAGVHARGQVASCATGSALDAGKIHAALNGMLPEDIVIHSVEDVPSGFHARFGAVSREYSYTITTIPRAIDRRTVWFVKYRLARDLLHAVASEIAGRHDFTSFCKHEAEVANRMCTVTRSQWEERGSLIVYHIAADRFVHGMVRALVGTMVDVARGYFEPDAFARILGARDRSKAGTAAPAHGLVLERVVYE